MNWLRNFWHWALDGDTPWGLPPVASLCLTLFAVALVAGFIFIPYLFAVVFWVGVIFSIICFFVFRAGG